MTCSFFDLLIFCLFTLINIYYLEFISHYIKEILYINTNSKGNIKEIQTDLHFHVPQILILKNPILYVELKLLISSF